MSALLFPAQLAAQRALTPPARLFADLAQAWPDAAQLRLETAGHTLAGRGAASYVADALADEGMLAAHPRFVVRTASGRIVRLLPEGGTLSAEQGGALGDGAGDDRNALQAALDYAAKVGAHTVLLESRRYRIDCPVRTSPAADVHAEDGHPLVVTATVTLRGGAGEPSVLDFRAAGGGDPETSWQTVPRAAGDATPVVWRGGGVFVAGDIADPAPGPRRIAQLTLENLVLQGNRLRTGVHTWPADPATGDGWDVTDKALWVQDCHVGAIVCRDVAMTGWKGEIFYCAGTADAVERVELARCRFATTNGSALNAATNCVLLAEDCEFGDAFQAQEDVGKARARYRGCRWFDCDSMGIGNGPAGAFQYTLAYPTRDAAAALPAIELLDCRFESIGLLWVTSWVSGRITTVDTTLVVDGPGGMAVRDIDLDIDAWLDRGPTREAAIVYGVDSLTDPVPGAPAGTWRQPPRGVRLRLRHYRSALAQERGVQWQGLRWQGYVARDCRFEVAGEFAHARTPNGGPDPVAMPHVAFAGGLASTAYSPGGWYGAPALTGSGRFAPPGPLAVLTVASEQAVALTLPAAPAGGADYGYADGQTVRLAKQYDQGSIVFAKGAAASMALTATRTLDLADDWIEFTYNRTRGRWEESGFFSAA